MLVLLITYIQSLLILLFKRLISTLIFVFINPLHENVSTRDDFTWDNFVKSA